MKIYHGSFFSLPGGISQFLCLLISHLHVQYTYVCVFVCFNWSLVLLVFVNDKLTICDPIKIVKEIINDNWAIKWFIRIGPNVKISWKQEIHVHQHFITYIFLYQSKVEKVVPQTLVSIWHQFLNWHKNCIFTLLTKLSKILPIAILFLWFSWRDGSISLRSWWHDVSILFRFYDFQIRIETSEVLLKKERS